MTTGHLTIIGCGLGPDDLTPRHRQAVEAADLLAGGQRLLAWFPEFPGETIVLDHAAATAAAALAESARRRRVAVLASGDPLFFGIARLFTRLLPPEMVTILPNVSAAQAALARLKLPWHGTRFFSVHGREAPLPWERILRAPSAIVYCDGVRTPQQVAATLVERHPAAASRPAALAADLGAADETLREASLGELARQPAVGTLAMLVLLPPAESAPGAATAPPLPLGLPDAAYDHEHGLITHPEIRAVALAKLRLRPGVLWDLGAGSGSVAVEAAGLCEGLRAYAVEGKPERCRQIQANAERFGRAGITVIQEDILAAIPRLPPPDAVFIGGGGSQIAEIATAAFAALRPGGVLVAAAILNETRAALAGILAAAESEVLEIAVRRQAPLGHGTMMKPENAVLLAVFAKRPEGN
ncbi:MAG: precorrin-6y C5,15-methyltransferase (decarboxylating) subunit CbiE [Lentisphaeria bacterium]|jgi:precorrin-6Y C5,15-methyltransferase (decarboxylating)